MDANELLKKVRRIEIKTKVPSKGKACLLAMSALTSRGMMYAP
jgi:hypothetical protein